MKKNSSKRAEASDEKRDGAAQEKFTAFTIRADGPMAVVLLDVEISPARAPGRALTPEAMHKCRAAWNTAIRRSRISSKIVRTLGLQPRRGDGPETAEQYLVDIYLPNRIRFASVVADKMEDAGVGAGVAVECMVGMDIIRHGDCSISHRGGKTMFSFRAPSLGGVDYVELAPAPAKRDVVTVMARRNQMCPCGSGKRYKNCCGKLV